MMDEKFIDYFIDQSEEIAPGESEYWVVRDNEKQSLKSKHTGFVSTVSWESGKIAEFAERASQYERLIMHSYFFPHLDRFFKLLSGDVKVIWMFWGGDGYAFSANTKQWFLPLTWKWKMENKTKNVSVMRGLARRILFYKQQWEKSVYIRRLIKRTDVCATWVKDDYEMIKKINPSMTWAFYSYFTYEQMVFSDLEPARPDFNRLWLGNSATDTNNHFDALEYLSKIGWPGEIIAPLSYGSSGYADEVIRFGKERFGDRFIPLKKLMPLQEYQSLMNSCGIIWMNHIRQQAAGNIIAALFMGKAVILNPENTIYKTLRGININFSTKESILNISTDQEQTFESNKDKIKSFFSQEKILDSLRLIYS